MHGCVCIYIYRYLSYTLLIYTYWYLHIEILYIYIYVYRRKITEYIVNRFWHGHPSPTFAVGSIYQWPNAFVGPLVSDRKTGRALS